MGDSSVKMKSIIINRILKNNHGHIRYIKVSQKNIE